MSVPSAKQLQNPFPIQALMFSSTYSLANKCRCHNTGKVFDARQAGQCQHVPAKMQGEGRGGVLGLHSKHWPALVPAMPACLDAATLLVSPLCIVHNLLL
jgi:hypothetical protein